jgi:hypothetical protein
MRAVRQLLRYLHARLGVRSAWKGKAAVVSQTGLSLESELQLALSWWACCAGIYPCLEAFKTDEEVQRICRHIHHVPIPLQRAIPKDRMIRCEDVGWLTAPPGVAIIRAR